MLWPRNEDDRAGGAGVSIRVYFEILPGTMKKNTLPALGIVLVTLILLVINEFTDTTVIKDYAFLFIIGGMLLGVFLTRLGDRSKN